jgi:phospholipid/cholesterol/gamma-HCH transport system permease protein
LTVISDLCGITGGFVYAIAAIHLDANQYWWSAFHILDFTDLAQGLVKPVVFGVIVATVGCYYGLSTRGGTQGVGRSTTQSVVVASVLIIVSDFIVSRLIIGITS